MRLISFNVEYCQGINNRWKYLEVPRYMVLIKKNLIKLAETLKEYYPDILGLIEVDSGIRELKKGRPPTDYFSEKLKLPYIAAKTKYSRESFYKLLNSTPVGRTRANAILSNQPLYDVKYYFLSKGVKRLVIHAIIRLAVNGKLVNLNLFAVHLALTRMTRQQQLREISEIVNSTDGPKIVFGDFNNFKGYEELYYLMENSKLINATKFAGAKLIKTYPSWKPKMQLDHVMVSQDIKVKQFRVLPINLSDHLPVMIDFDLE